MLLQGAAGLMVKNISAWTHQGISETAMAAMTTYVSRGSRGLAADTPLTLSEFFAMIEARNRSFTSSFPAVWASEVRQFAEMQRKKKRDLARKQRSLLELARVAVANVKSETPFFDSGSIAGFGRFTFFVHNAGGNLPHHHESTFNVLTVGAKRWILWDYTKQPEVEQVSYKQYPPSTQSRSRSWFESHLRDVKQPYWDFLQQAGDVVYIPDSFTHVTTDLCIPSIGAALGVVFPSDLQRKEITYAQKVQFRISTKLGSSP